MYRIRKSWDQPETQIGAFMDLDNAKKAVESTDYNIYNDAGRHVHPFPVEVQIRGSGYVTLRDIPDANAPRSAWAGAGQTYVARGITDNELFYKLDGRKYITTNPSMVQVTGRVTPDYGNVGNGNTEKDSEEVATLGSLFIEKGREYLGVPYEFGAKPGQTDTFDCSSFTQHVIKEVTGYQIPRTSANQARMEGKRIDNKADLKPGDLMFWSDTGTHRLGDITHVGFYVDENSFLGAQASTGVAEANPNSNYWSSRYEWGLRITGAVTGGQNEDDSDSESGSEGGSGIEVNKDELNIENINIFFAWWRKKIEEEG
jgi:cell wall-associated NlpC family hydrolase